MAARAQSSISPAIATSPSKRHSLIANPFLCLNFSKPFSSFIAKPSLTLSRLTVSHIEAVSPKRSYKLLAVSGLANGNSETNPEAENDDSAAGPRIDIKLPRRSLLVQFTCDECGERSQRIINRLAYERGLVYVQCAGCERYHKLADNLGLVIEYDLREESSAESDTSEV